MIFSARAAILPITVLLLGHALAQDSPDSVLKETKTFRKNVLISGLAGPWELTWGPDNMLWVTERTGKRITRVDPASGKSTVAIRIDEVSAPGAQDGLLGMALHPELLQGTGNDYVYAAYTYSDPSRRPYAHITDPASPYRFLFGKIVRFTYDKAEGKLSNPVEVLAGLPAGNDHVAGRLKIGPDRKLYFTIGDQGHDQLGNFCLPIESQRLPTQAEINAKDYASYVGKSLRFNLDGSIPNDNPKLAGVVSHVFTYGHRNPQGLDFGPDGTLYSSEQGPKTDDEVNILKSGSNYGWPHVAGKQDNNAYEYARWSEASTPCSQLTFSDLAIHPSVPREPESAFKKPFVEPIATMFTVPTGFNFHDPACKGVDVLCWPTTGASSIEYYASKGTGIPGWDHVLLVTTLKRGSLYVVPLTVDGKAKAGYLSRYFHSDNRYRDTALSPDRKTIYIATDPGGFAEAVGGGPVMHMENPGAILAFTYVREGAPAAGDSQRLTEASPGSGPAITGSMAGGVTGGVPPVYTAAQAAAGKTAYNASCAACHGNTMTNGTFGPPLAGEFFQNKWHGRTVQTFYDKSKTMPPAAPASLKGEAYANIVAYILQMNGVKPGKAKLQPGSEALGKMTIQ
ncbi:MAG: glucose/sorbosone family PQQ-dependent dehydrogenase [Bryobacteraceae bacterium]